MGWACGGTSLSIQTFLSNLGRMLPYVVGFGITKAEYVTGNIQTHDGQPAQVILYGGKMETLTEKEYSGENFVEAAFSGKSLAGITFEDCTFVKCNFRQTSLARARFSDCTFSSCDLSNVPVQNCRFRKTTFEHCKLLGVQWIHAEDFNLSSFKECNLNYCNFLGLKLKKTVFLKCSLRDADFSQADLSEGSLRESDLLNTRFQHSTLSKADFRGAMNYLINPIENKVQGARFSLPEAQGLIMGLGVVLD